MGLWERVKDHLEHRTPLREDKDGHLADIEVQVATAILLLEAAYGDEEYVWREQRAIVRSLERAFGIGRAETLHLLDRAEVIRPPVVLLADVTQVIAERYTQEQRRSIVELLWRVIAADDVVAAWEEAFADHVAQAVGLSRAEADSARRSALP
jgi:uncharacterized tellurite resistance protein B-like protein